MNLGDLVVKYSHDYDNNNCDIIIEDVGILLGGSWREGMFHVFFSQLGLKSTSTGTIRRIALRR